MKEREERNMKEAKKATLKLRREGKARKERWKKRKGSIWGYPWMSSFGGS